MAREVQEGNTVDFEAPAPQRYGAYFDFEAPALLAVGNLGYSAIVLIISVPVYLGLLGAPKILFSGACRNRFVNKRIETAVT
jgi:hypothetical protein